MARPSPTTRPAAVTGSAAIVQLSKSAELKRQAEARRPWQDAGLGFYRTMPEIRYPSNFIGACLGRYLLRIGLRPEDDPTGPPTVWDGPDKPDFVRIAEESIADLSGSQGGLPEILSRYGINLNVAGDGWLLGTDIREKRQVVDTDWEFLSIKELVFADYKGEKRVFRDPVGDGSDIIDEDHLLPTRGVYYRRFWKPHPVHSLQADGAMEALRDDCERLRLLNQSISARLTSRLASRGIFFVPNSITMPVAIEASDQVNEVDDPVIRRIIAFMEAAMTQRGTAAEWMPIFVRGPEEAGEKIRHIILEAGIDKTEMALRQELRSNIAVGLDLPREASEGLGEASHWTSWSIKDDTQQAHIQPMADRFADGLLRVKVIPDLKAENVERRDWSRVVVIADGSAVVAKPNAADDARQLHDRMVVKDKVLRQMSGRSDDDAPDEEEYVRQLGRNVNNPWLATYGLKIHGEIDWEQASKVAAGPGKPGVGSVPEDKRKADNTKPAGSPGASRGGAGGVRPPAKAKK